MKKNWKKKGIEAGHAGCLCCPGNVELLPLSTVLYQGFGGYCVLKDGKIIHSDDPKKEMKEFKKLQYFEDMAKSDPLHDYRVTLDLPLRDAVYQRHDDDKWVLIKSGEGFA